MSEFQTVRERFERLVDEHRPDEAASLMEDALDAALDGGDIRLATLLANISVSPMVSVGRTERVLAVLDRVLASVDCEDHPGQRGRLLAARASALRSCRRYDEALEAETEAISCLDGRAPESALTTLRHDRSVLLAELGYADEAVAGLAAAREAFLGMRDRVGVAASDHNLSFVLHDLGAFDDAVEYLTEARDIFLAIDMPEEAASCDQNLGVVLYDLGRFTEAGRRFAIAHNRFSKVDATASAAECDANLSALLATMGHEDEAARYRSRAEAAGVGMPTTPGTSAQVPAVSGDELAAETVTPSTGNAAETA